MVQVMSIPEVANRIGVSRQTIYAWIKDGRLLTYPRAIPATGVRLDEAQNVKAGMKRGPKPKE